MTRTVVFHIGLAKTGTTSFQHFCHARRRWLLTQGVLYPKGQIGRGRNHSPLVASYIPHRPEGPSVAMRWESRRDAVARLRAEIEGGDAGTVLISSEHFSTHFDRSEVAELASDFAGYDLRAVAVVRDTYARFLSSYNTHVTAGGCLGLEDYARTMLVPGTRFMSAAETLRIWQDGFGADCVRVVDYDTDPDVTPALLRQCGIESLPLGSSTFRDRTSLDPGTVEALRSANQTIRERQTTAPEASLAAWLQMSAFSILARRRLGSAAQDRQPMVWRVGSQTLASLDAIAADDRRFLADTFGLSSGSSVGRARIVVVDRPAADPAQAARGQHVAKEVMRGWWGASERLVGVSSRLAALRRRAASSPRRQT